MSRDFWIAATLACVVVGCTAGGNSKSEDLADVRGTVTFCGAPANAELIFEPIGSAQFSGGRPSSAVTDENGEFILYHSSDQKGSKTGENRISIKIHGIAGREITRSAPGTALLSTWLVRDVKPGQNQFHFVLTF